MDAKTDWTGIARNLLWKKAPTEIIVLHEKFFATNFLTVEEMWIITIAREPQCDFEQA